jgi:hypothetical protein
LQGQQNRTPATIQDAIDFVQSRGCSVDRLWLYHKLERHGSEVTQMKPIALDPGRHFVDPKEVSRYFRELEEIVADIPSLFIWNVDETRVGSPKKGIIPTVIVSPKTNPKSLTISQYKDDAQLIMVAAISAFGDSTPPMFISKNITFERDKLATMLLFESHDYTIRHSPSTFINEVLFIDWIENVFLTRINCLRSKMNYNGKVVLIVDGHASHVTPRVVAFAASQDIILIRLVAHSSHIAQPLDFCLFGMFKLTYKKEKQTQQFTGETKKLYKALLAFYKSTILPIVRHSFARAGILLHLGDMMGAVHIDSKVVLDRLVTPQIPVDETFVFPVEAVNEKYGKPKTRSRSPIPRPTPFAITLAAYVDKVTNKCPLCGADGLHIHHDGQNHE